MSLFRKTTVSTETSQAEIPCNPARGGYEHMYTPSHPVLAWKHTSAPAKNDHLDNYVEIDPFHSARQTARLQHGFIAAEPKKKASPKSRPQKRASKMSEIEIAERDARGGPSKKASPEQRFGDIFNSAESILVFTDKPDETNVEVTTEEDVFGFFGEDIDVNSFVISTGGGYRGGKSIDFVNKTAEEVCEIIRGLF
jgi:hypothetical protein